LQGFPAPFTFIKRRIEHREMRVQLRVGRPAARMRERGGGEIAGRPIHLAALFSHPCCGKGFKFAERNARGLLMRRHQPFISQRHRQDRNRFRRGTGEIIKHPPLTLLQLPLRQPFAGFRILIFAKRMKLFAGDSVLQSQPFRARADPLAGTYFARRVVIILRQVLARYCSPLKSSRRTGKKTLQICGAGQESRKRPTLVMGKNPSGKCQLSTSRMPRRIE
jgi:hypothetical protein